MVEKKNSIVYVIFALAVVLYSAIVWLLPWEKTGNLILAYVGTLLVFVVLFFVWKFVWADSKSAMSKFYGIPVIRVGLIYLGVQIVFSFLVMLLSEFISGRVVVLIDILFMCLFLFGIITAKEIKSQIDNLETKQQVQTIAIKKLRVEAKYLSGAYQNPEIQKHLHQIEEQLKYSDPVSSPELETEEKSLMLLLEQIKEVLQKNDLKEFEKKADQFLTELGRRNDLCKIYKRQ